MSHMLLRVCDCPHKSTCEVSKHEVTLPGLYTHFAAASRSELSLRSMDLSLHSMDSLNNIRQRKLDDEEKSFVDSPVDVPPPIDTVSPFHPSQFPDGGKDAWLCLLGSTLVLFCSFGWLNCVGVFQTYYQENLLKEYSSSTIAWISSMEIFIMFVLGPVVGFFYDNHGPKYLLIYGAFMHVLGLMLTSVSTQYWQIMLAQGICSPLGLNALFNAAMGSVTSWFFKKRGMAMGVTAAGSGLGGVILPIMNTHLIQKVGFGWAMRSTAFLILGLLLVGIFTIKSRLPAKPRTFEVAHFVAPFKDRSFVLTTAAAFLFFMGLFIPITFVEVQALANGMSKNLAAYLIPILNAASIFGRITPGVLADKFGRYNMQVIMSYFTVVVVLGLWLPSSNNAAFIAFAALYGFASGAFISLAPAQIASISKVEQIGLRTGVMFSVISFAGLAGSPVGGAIIARNNGSFHGLQVFAGVMPLAGATMFVLARATLVGFKIKVKV